MIIHMKDSKFYWVDETQVEENTHDHFFFWLDVQDDHQPV
jgi:hypothetical protein